MFLTRLFNNLPVAMASLACSLTLFSQAQAVVTLHPSRETVRIGKSFEFFMDSTNTMELDKVLKEAPFKEVKQNVPSFTTQATLFGRIKLTTTATRDFYMKIDPATLERFSLFQKKGNDPLQEIKSGILVPLRLKDYHVGSFLFKLDVSPGDTTIVLLKIRTVTPINLDIQVGSSNTLLNKFHAIDLYNGICLGIIIMMLIYNLFLWVSQRKREYMWYVFYLATTLIILPFSVLGYSAHFPQFMMDIYQNSSSWYSVGPIIFLLLFIMELFRGMLPRWLRITNYVFIASSVIAIAFGSLGFTFISIQIVLVQNMLIIFPCIIAGVIAIRKKHGGAIYYLIGYTVFLSGFTALILAFMGIVSYDIMEGIKMHTAGTAFECVLLSFALGNKLKVSQIEKEKSQEEFIKKSQENERLIREQNVILEERVNERTVQLSSTNLELRQQKNEIERQKHIAEEHRQEMVDSITYAKRIQQAMLPPLDLVRQKLPDTFIYYQPKDIVAGDFYWLEESDNKLFIAAADCTGHGVPGALVSVVCSNALNRAVNEFRLTDTGLILDKVTDLVIEAFEKSTDNVQDGMDISLLAIEFDNNDKKSITGLQWSGANNPLWFIEQGELKKIGADKQPIGKNDLRKPFTSHRVPYSQGTIFFLLTDGYPDQFGGPKGKKFKHKQLEVLLQLIFQKSPEEQVSALNTAFTDWKGNLEQVDDVTLIGIRL